MYSDQLLLAVHKWHVVYSHQLLGAGHYIAFNSPSTISFFIWETKSGKERFQIEALILIQNIQRTDLGMLEVLLNSPSPLHLWCEHDKDIFLVCMRSKVILEFCGNWGNWETISFIFSFMILLLTSLSFFLSLGPIWGTFAIVPMVIQTT